MPSILICTDEAIQAYFVTCVLTKAGYRVAQLKASSPSGIESALRLEPDLILLDVNLNAIGSVETVEAILDQAKCPTILLVTSRPSAGQKAFTANAATTLTKPFTSAELLSAIDRAAGSRRVEPSDRANASLHGGTGQYDSSSHRTG